MYDIKLAYKMAPFCIEGDKGEVVDRRPGKLYRDDGICLIMTTRNE